MGAMERITIDIPAEVAATLRQSVADGNYESEGQIVSEALRGWAAVPADDQSLRDAVATARNRPWVAAEESFARVRARIRERLAAR